MGAQTRDQILSTISAHGEEIRAAGVRRLGVFGSFVRNEQTPESDLDVLVGAAQQQEQRHVGDLSVPACQERKLPTVIRKTTAGRARRALCRGCCLR